MRCIQILERIYLISIVLLNCSFCVGNLIKKLKTGKESGQILKSILMLLIMQIELIIEKYFQS